MYDSQEEQGRRWRAVISILSPGLRLDANDAFVFSTPHASDKPVLGANDRDTQPLADDLANTDVAMVRDYLPSGTGESGSSQRALSFV